MAPTNRGKEAPQAAPECTFEQGIHYNSDIRVHAPALAVDDIHGQVRKVINT